MKRALLLLLLPPAAALILAGALFLPLPLPAYLDFQVLYHANMGLLRGIALYDRAAQIEMIARLAGVSPERVFVLPFPYPPWYALATLFLAWLPIAAAARLWFLLNLGMLLLSIWLLSDGWQPLRRLAAFFAAFLFAPAIGSLFVGQYVFPVLLGAALLVHSLRHKQALRPFGFAQGSGQALRPGSGQALLTVAAMALLTFKPHLGGLILLADLIHLLARRDSSARRALAAALATAALLFALGFLADPVWPVNYLRSLGEFRQVSGVSACDLCASLPVIAIEMVTGQVSLTATLPLAAALLVGLSGWLIWKRPLIWRSPEYLSAAAALVTLLASPYLLNYDFTLLLLPLGLLAGDVDRPAGWLWLAAVYFLPWLALGLWGRAGNFSLPLAALTLFVMLFGRAPRVDVSRVEA